MGKINYHVRQENANLNMGEIMMFSFLLGVDEDQLMEYHTYDN